MATNQDQDTSNRNLGKKSGTFAEIQMNPKKQSMFKRASFAIPEIQPAIVDPRFFNHPITATLYPIRPTGFNPFLCCEACWCKGHSLINGSIAVAALEVLVGVVGIFVALIRFHMKSDFASDVQPNFFAYKTKSLFGTQTINFDAAPHSEKRSNRNELFKNSRVKHFGLSDNERDQAEDIMIWFVGILAFVCCLASIVLIISAVNKNRGLANTSLLLHLLITLASWVYVVIMVMYVIFICAGEGPTGGKTKLVVPFLVDGFIIGMTSVLLIFGTLCSNALFHAFEEIPMTQPFPVAPPKSGATDGIKSSKASVTAV